MSAVNPPLVKGLSGAAALAAGARPPTPEAIGDGEQGRVAEAFMRLNAARYHSVFFAGRCMIIALSLLLGWVVWRWSRRMFGPGGALFSLALYALSPEVLAHSGLVTLDLGTALGFTASLYCFWGFARTGRWSWWLATAVAVGATFLTRFAAVLLVPMLVSVAWLGIVLRRPRRAGRVWLGLGLFVLSTLAILAAGYHGGVSFQPLAGFRFESRPFQILQHALPWLRVPVPDLYLGGFDRQLVESGPNVTTTFLFGRERADSPWYYFPVALALKWPLAFLLTLLLRAGRSKAIVSSSRRLWNELTLLVPVAFYLAVAMFVSNLCIGIRYVLPILPLLCVWGGGLVAPPVPRRLTAPGRASPRTWMRAAVTLTALLAVETAATAPWYLAFFNAAAGGPGRGDRLINDSNVDWGQGLIALRGEMRRRGIERVHLAYLGTTDPAVYGIDYIPYLGGQPGTESDWLAVSSYYFVGMSQRMMTRSGRTEFVRLDFRPLWGVTPVARPARCMYLFRVR